MNDATVEFLDGLEHIDSREMVEKVASEKVGKGERLISLFFYFFFTF